MTWLVLIIVFVIWVTPPTFLLFELLFLETRYQSFLLLYKLIFLSWLIMLPLFQYIPILYLFNDDLSERILYGMVLFWIALIIESVWHIIEYIKRKKHNKATHAKQINSQPKKLSKKTPKSHVSLTKPSFKEVFSSPQIAWYSISLMLIYINSILQLTTILQYPPFFYILIVIVILTPQAMTAYRQFKSVQV